MTFAKLSEGAVRPTFGGCDQLLSRSTPKIAGLLRHRLRAEKNVLVIAMDLLSRIGTVSGRLLKLFPLSIHSRTYAGSSPASSHPPGNLLETSLRRDLPASRLVSPKRCSVVRSKERFQFRDLLRLHMPA